MISTFIKHAP